MVTDVAFTNDETGYGPAMLKLTINQRRFVLYLLDNIGCNWQAAYIAAGYSNTTSALAAGVNQLRHNPKIIAALAEMCRRRLDSGSLAALNALDTIVNNPNHKSHFEAIRLVLALTGFQEVKQQKIEVDHNLVHPQEAIAKLKALAQRQGIPADRLLEQCSEVTDVEFVEVEPQPAGLVGLEDVI